MNDSEQVLDELEAQIPSLSRAAVSFAQMQALASGQIVLVSDDAGVYRAFSDGNRELVKPLEKPLSVPIGTRIMLS